MSRIALSVLFLFGLHMFPSIASAERRVALIIGNGAYQNAPRLPNPKNDAEDVAAALKRTGFETIIGLDLDKAGMEDVTIRFARAARDADVALFYYSGHAMQFAGVNYLMPIDAKLTDEADLRRLARIDEIIADVQQAKNLRIVVLDSCRDNPLADELKRSIGRTRAAPVQRGLARLDSPQGMIIAYATQAGRTAEDGSGRNSPYTAAFLRHIEATEEIGTVFRRVSASVYEETKRQQLPELSLSLIGEFYLKGRAAPPPVQAAAAAEPRIVSPPPPQSVPSPPKPAARAPATGVLDQIQRRGVLNCGTNGSMAGFSIVDSRGNFTGLDVDFCRAIAAAIFDDPAKVKFVALTAKERFVTLQNGEVDVLARNTTKTAKRESELGLRFGPVNFHDGQAFMVRKSLGVKTAGELSGATVCVLAGTTTELGVTDYFRARNMQFRSVLFDQWSEVVAAYDAGRCDALTTDRSSLYTERAKLKAPNEHVVLPDLISNEPIAPAIRKGDDQWFDIVRWVHYAMVASEELGVTQATVATDRNSTDPRIRSLLGLQGDFGSGLGLANDWADRIVRHVGNYGEAYDRSFGARSNLKMERGPNALTGQGGQQQAPPLR